MHKPAKLDEIALALRLGMMGAIPIDRMQQLPDALPVPIHEGKSGPWTIKTDDLGAVQSIAQNLQSMLHGSGFDSFIKPGRYTQLLHKERGVVMSNTPMEVTTNMDFIKAAQGRVAINGLGLGMVVLALLQKPKVQHITVFEIDPHIIAMVGDWFLMNHGDKVRIVQADALTSTPGPKEHYDIVWHDIWDDITDLRIPEMERLRAKWANHASQQMFWAEDRCHDMKACIDYVQWAKDNGIKGQL